MKKQSLTLGLGPHETPVTFHLDVIKYNNFLNSGAGKNKVQAVRNFLVTCCDDKDKPKLNEIMAQEPGAQNSILEGLLNEYAPDVAVVVKKSETEQSGSELTG